MEDLIMKAATVVAVALATFSSFPSPAQQQQQPMQQQQDQQQAPSTTSPGPQSQPGADKSQPSAAAILLKPVTGELVSKLDSKSAREGDSVVLKTKEDVKFSGGVEIPKGSNLVGHVTNVQARANDKENSQIAIQFDQAELKDGQSVAIESVIQSVSPAPGAGNTTDNGVPVNDGTAPAPASSPSGGTPSSPAMTGANRNMNQNAGNSRPGLESNTTAEPSVTDQNTNSGMPAPGSIVARNGTVAIRATAIPGVLIANNIDGLPFRNASGMLLGARRDIHLDSGAQMVLAVAGVPQGTGR
jgi:hypothetical protein